MSRATYRVTGPGPHGGLRVVNEKSGTVYHAYESGTITCVSSRKPVDVGVTTERYEALSDVVMAHQLRNAWRGAS